MKQETTSTLTAFALVLAIFALFPSSPARAACDSGVKLDKTTVESTRQLLEKAGYKNIREWRKGCDNVWHATALKDGAPVHVAVLPDGRIVKEGD